MVTFYFSYKYVWYRNIVDVDSYYQCLLIRLLSSEAIIPSYYRNNSKNIYCCVLFCNEVWIVVNLCVSFITIDRYKCVHKKFFEVLEQQK